MVPYLYIFQFIPSKIYLFWIYFKLRSLVKKVLQVEGHTRTGDQLFLKNLKLIYWKVTAGWVSELLDLYNAFLLLDGLHGGEWCDWEFGRRSSGWHLLRKSRSDYGWILQRRHCHLPPACFKDIFSGRSHVHFWLV